MKKLIFIVVCGIITWVILYALDNTRYDCPETVHMDFNTQKPLYGFLIPQVDSLGKIISTTAIHNYISEGILELTQKKYSFSDLMNNEKEWVYVVQQENLKNYRETRKGRKGYVLEWILNNHNYYNNDDYIAVKVDAYLMNVRTQTNNVFLEKEKNDLYCQYFVDYAVLIQVYLDENCWGFGDRGYNHHYMVEIYSLGVLVAPSCETIKKLQIDPDRWGYDISKNKLEI